MSQHLFATVTWESPCQILFLTVHIETISQACSDIRIRQVNWTLSPASLCQGALGRGRVCVCVGGGGGGDYMSYPDVLFILLSRISGKKWHKSHAGHDWTQNLNTLLLMSVLHVGFFLINFFFLGGGGGLLQLKSAEDFLCNHLGYLQQIVIVLHH